MKIIAAKRWVAPTGPSAGAAPLREKRVRERKTGLSAIALATAEGLSLTIHYRIERTRNRTSSASFTEEGVLIRLAGNLSLIEEERHIASLIRRMAKRAARECHAERIAPFEPLLHGASDLTLTFGNGRTRRFTVMTGTRPAGRSLGKGRTSARRMKEGWTIRRSPHTDDDHFLAFLWRLLSISEQPWAEAAVREANARTFRAHIARVRLRHMQSRFGSCTKGGRITLNTALLFVPEALRTSVIIHELAHILHPNHSHAFWRAVAAVMPEYEEYKRALRAYRLCGGQTPEKDRPQRKK